MKYIAIKDYEVILIPYDKYCFFIVNYRKTGIERVYIIKRSECTYIESIENKELMEKLIGNLLKTKIYRGKRELEEVLIWTEAFGDLFIYEIDKKDPLFIEIMNSFIQNYNPNDDIIKQFLVNKIITTK